MEKAEGFDFDAPPTRQLKPDARVRERATIRAAHNRAVKQRTLTVDAGQSWWFSKLRERVG